MRRRSSSKDPGTDPRHLAPAQSTLQQHLRAVSPLSPTLLPPLSLSYSLIAKEKGLAAASEGRYAEALPLLERAISKMVEGSTAERFARATLRNALGGVHKALGRHADAENMYRQALNTFEDEAQKLGEKVPGSVTDESKEDGYQMAALAGAEAAALAGAEAAALAREEAAVVRSNLGTVLAETAPPRVEEARVLYEQALTVFEPPATADEKDSADEARLDEGDARPTLADEISDETSDETFDETLGEISARVRLEMRLADVLNNLADLDHSARRMHEAERGYQRALSLRSAALGEKHEKVYTISTI